MRSKNPAGLSQNETVSTAITGHSSGRVMWWIPNTYQSTMSVSWIERSCAVQTGSPRELYDAPVNRYVADFIGQSNFFAGSLVEAVDAIRAKLL